jgi:hypothetical protein
MFYNRSIILCPKPSLRVRGILALIRDDINAGVPNTHFLDYNFAIGLWRNEASCSMRRTGP